MARTTDEIRALVELGFTPQQIVEMERNEGSSSTGAASTVAAPPAAKPATPEFLIRFAQNKAARRALAADMRARKVEITPASWKKAKKAAGIA